MTLIDEPTSEAESPVGAIEPLTDEEAALAAILLDSSGLDIAEFILSDQSKSDLCYRAKAFQWNWWRSREPRQADQASRDVGKSEGLMLRTLAFPFTFPGEEMTIFTPEFTHINRIAERIESRIITNWFFRALTRPGRSGITHRPFCIFYANGARVISSLPQRSGIGAKGAHSVRVEIDECFPGGTLVLTKKGLVPIEDIRIGDMVLTHRRRWRPVTATASRSRPTVIVKGMGHPGLTVSENHPFWAARRLPRTLQPIDGELRHVERAVVAPDWVPAKELAHSYWGSPTRFPKEVWVPSFIPPGRPAKKITSTKLVPCEQANEDFMWLVGLWLAEGSITGSKVIWSVHTKEVPDVAERMNRLGLNHWDSPVSSTEHCRNVHVASVVLAGWLVKHCGKGAHNKEVPSWALGLAVPLRRALLEGLIYGDGFRTGRRDEWKLTTVSKRLAVSARMLAMTLDYAVSVHWCDTSDRQPAIRGRSFNSNGFFQVVGRTTHDGFDYQHQRFALVREVTPTGRIEPLYDLTVEEDESFVADGFTVHNSQDLSAQAWKEIPNTISWEKPGARWYLHGVSKGVRDDFFDYTTKPELGFTVHRITQMHREDWTEERRQQLIEEFGGTTDSPDYKRNVRGEHGDTSNVIFILSNLMAGCSTDESSFFNLTEYTHFDVRGPELQSRVEAMGGRAADARIEESSEHHVLAMQQMLDFPALHRERYEVFWAGMDVGLVDDPSEILIFAEYHPDAAERRQDRAAKLAVPLDGLSRLKLINRISMRWIPAPLQADVIMWVIEEYKPRAFSMDSTGLGQPVFQELQKRAGASRMRVMDYGDESKIPVAAVDARNRRQAQAREALTTIKGYNFCTDEETEILTKRGWLRYDEVRVGDETLGLTMDGTSRWTPITAVNVFDGPHEVHSLEGQTHSSVTTGSHRWLAKPHNGNYKLRWISTDELTTSRIQHGIPVAATRADNPTVPTIKDDLVELAAWYFTEGWIDRDGETIDIGQSLTTNSPECRRIEALLSRLMGPGQFNPGQGNGIRGQGWTCSSSPVQYRGRRLMQNAYHVKDRPICAAIRDLVVGEDKVPTPEFLTSLTGDQLDLFVEVCMLGDGSRTLMVRPGRTDRMTNFFHQENEDRSRAFEMACALRGQGFTHRLYKDQTCWTTNQLCRRQVWSSCMRHERRTIEGIVWCPTTETGTWLARRDGTVYFTGNSGKVIVGFDESKVAAMKAGASPQEVADEAGLTQWVKQASTDFLRGIVDTRRHMLPYDKELLRQWNAQTWQYGQGGVTAYGNRKTYSNVKVHTLDAGRMAILGRELEPIEEFLREPPMKAQPVYDYFVEG